MKKIVVACDSFKESMSALEACDSIERGLRRCKVPFRIEKIPLADGGEGTSEILQFQRNCHRIKKNVQNPLSQVISCYYWMDNCQRTAYIDVAMACGMGLISPEDRNPLKASSYGLGQLIFDAISNNAKQVLIGLGGSCTNDGGMGMLRALGTKFYRKDGTECTELEHLIELDHLDISVTKRILSGVNIVGLYDVENKLLGRNGATYTFGPQKGADILQMNTLEYCLSKFDKIVQKQEHINRAEFAGSGAAGGIGFALYLLDAQLVKGIDYILEYLNFDHRIQETDWIFTGEGRIDDQTIHGKTISGVLQYAKSHQIPVIGVAGSLATADDSLYKMGMCSMFSIVNEAKSLSCALKDGKQALEEVSYNIGRIILR